MLELKGLELRRKGQLVARIPSLTVARPGMLWVVGPGGAGKSTLLTALAGGEAANEIAVTGQCCFDGEPIERHHDEIAWLPQHTRSAVGADTVATSPGRAPQGTGSTLAPANGTGLRSDAEPVRTEEQRHAAVMAGLARCASLYLIDEPTQGLAEPHAAEVRSRIRELCSRATVVAITHNRQDCLATGGVTALLAGGAIQEIAPTLRFFSSPETDAGRAYVETGNCSVAPVRAPNLSRDGVWWLVPGLLCGMSRPGLVGDRAAQYALLADHGVGKLLCLEEQCTYPTEGLREAGIARHHFPIPDMAPPSFAQAVDICRLVEAPIRSNQGVAVHCRGGLGRTGTVLALVLIWFGDAPDSAIAKVRHAQPHAIQTSAQLRFIHDFAERIRGWNGPQHQLGEQ